MREDDSDDDSEGDMQFENRQNQFHPELHQDQDDYDGVQYKSSPQKSARNRKHKDLFDSYLSNDVEQEQ